MACDLVRLLELVVKRLPSIEDEAEKKSLRNIDYAPDQRARARQQSP